VPARNGTALMLEDVGEELDASLTPVVAKQLLFEDGRLLIKIGAIKVEYDRNFRLFITTNLSNPHLLPRLFMQTAVIDFSVTAAALEEQLLADVVRRVHPELEMHKDKLVVSLAADAKQLHELEEKMLQKLRQQREGPLLEDDALVTALLQGKTTAAMIARRFSEALKTDADISAVREKDSAVC
jgi:dynein heavy chain